MGTNAEPRNLFKVDLIDDVELIAAFDLEQVGRDHGV